MKIGKQKLRLMIKESLENAKKSLIVEQQEDITMKIVDLLSSTLQKLPPIKQDEVLKMLISKMGTKSTNDGSPMDVTPAKE